MATKIVTVPAGLRPSERTAAYVEARRQARLDYPGAQILEIGGNRLKVVLPDAQEPAQAVAAPAVKASAKKAPAKRAAAKKAPAKKATKSTRKATKATTKKG